MKKGRFDQKRYLRSQEWRNNFSAKSFFSRVDGEDGDISETYAKDIDNGCEDEDEVEIFAKDLYDECSVNSLPGQKILHCCRRQGSCGLVLTECHQRFSDFSGK